MGSVRSQGPGWSFGLGSGKLESESSGCSLAEPEAGGLEGGDQLGCLGFRVCSPGLWLCSGPRLLSEKGARLSCWGTRASRNGGAGGKEEVLRCGVSPTVPVTAAGGSGEPSACLLSVPGMPRPRAEAGGGREREGSKDPTQLLEYEASSAKRFREGRDTNCHHHLLGVETKDQSDQRSTHRQGTKASEWGRGVCVLWPPGEDVPLVKVGEEGPLLRGGGRGANAVEEQELRAPGRRTPGPCAKGSG